MTLQYLNIFYYQNNLHNIKYQKEMLKVKSILLSKNQVQNSPSPDSKRSNIVQPTLSPVQQIQKILAINKQPLKIKKQISAHKLIPTNQKLDVMSSAKEQQYINRIKELEEQVTHYKKYVQQYEQLAYKNKRLEEQMSFILQQLQSRSIQQGQNYQQANSLTTPKNRIQNTPTIQSSREQYSRDLNSTPERHRHKYQGAEIQDQIEYLYQYVQNLQNTIHDIVSQSKQFQVDIKKNTKNQLNQMEQRLMNYIFGLEQRVSEATFRNNDIMKKFQTFRFRQDQFQLSRRSRKQSHASSTHKHNNQYGQTSSLMKLSNTQNNKNVQKDSIISFTNMDIIKTQQSKFQESEKTAKKYQQIKQPPQTPKIGLNKCLKCAQYLSIIDQMAEKCRNLQEQVTKLRNKLQLQRKQSIPKLNSSLAQNQKQSQNSLMNQNFILEKEQHLVQQYFSQKSQKSQKNDKIYERINTLQSHINIIMDSSSSSIYTNKNDSRNNAQFERSFAADNKKQHQQGGAQNYLRLQKVKDQLINIMQTLQQIIHQCETEPRNSMVHQLSRKLKVQSEYITDLEEQISKLRVQIQKNRFQYEKLQKVRKLSGTNEQHMESPYFRPLSDPISCIDHDQTKGKLSKILKSIKQFEIQLKSDSDSNLSQKNKKI